MILQGSQKCLCSNINWMQANYLAKQIGTLSHSKIFDLYPFSSYANSALNLLQPCSQSIIPSSSKRYKSKHSLNLKQGKFGGGGKSKFIYDKKFLAGGMVEPKLPWVTVTGQPRVKKTVVSKGGHTTSHRLTVLDQAYFDAITELMGSGEVGHHLAGKGLVITKVRVQEGLIGMKVFWTQTGGDLSRQAADSIVQQPGQQANRVDLEEQSIEALLKWAAPLLRQELANQRLVGCTVPHINFKQDLSLHNSLLVERILVKLKEELQVEDDCADEAAKMERELLLKQQQRLQVPDSIFASDFVYQPVFYDAANLPLSSAKKPLSSFTPFAPHGKGLRIEPKTPIENSAETDALLSNCSEDEATSSSNSNKTKLASTSAADTPIRLRRSAQHGIMLQNNVYGISRDRIIEKITASIGRMKEYTSVTNADQRFPFALRLSLPSGEPETSEPTIEQHFKSKNSIQTWAYKYAMKSGKKSDERNFVMKSAGIEEERIFSERESLKYDAFEEELNRVADEEDYWVEPNAKL